MSEYTAPFSTLRDSVFRLLYEHLDGLTIPQMRASLFPLTPAVNNTLEWVVLDAFVDGDLITVDLLRLRYRLSLDKWMELEAETDG